MKSMTLVFATLPLLLLVSACSILPSRSQLPAVYDLGMASRTGSAGLPLPTVQLGTVTESDWLSSTAMYYRLLYDDPQRLRSYVDSRWSGTPAELMEGRLELALAKIPDTLPSGGHYTLDVHMLTFEQDFSSPQAASVHLEVWVILRRSADQRRVAQRLFSYQKSGTPDARGAAEGFSALSNVFTSSLLKWIGSSVSVPEK